VEALRTALNRAYRVTESRSIIYRRIQSIIFVIIGAASMLALSFLIVLAPLAWATVMKWFPFIDRFSPQFTLIRYGIAGAVLVIALVIAHLWLPDGKRLLRDVVPGIAVTLALWLLGAGLFGAYLEQFADYASTYAGLASVMTALIFLYLVSAMFILGGELNAAMIRYREARAGLAEAD
jgi:membrane protein